MAFRALGKPRSMGSLKRIHENEGVLQLAGRSKDSRVAGGSWGVGLGGHSLARKGVSKKSKSTPVLTGKPEKLRAQLPYKRKLFMIFQTLDFKSRHPCVRSAVRRQGARQSRLDARAP